MGKRAVLQPAPPDSEVIEVLAKQFAWNFRYAGPDGRFGSTDIHLINDADNNPFGLDDRDPLRKTTSSARLFECRWAGL